MKTLEVKTEANVDYTEIKDDRIRTKICELMSEMLDNPNEHGIYPTSRFMSKMESFVLDEIKEKKSKLNPSEAVYGFAAWITAREREVKAGANNECSEVCELVKTFCEVNTLPPISENWPTNLIHPSGECSGGAT